MTDFNWSPTSPEIEKELVRISGESTYPVASNNGYTRVFNDFEEFQDWLRKSTTITHPSSEDKQIIDSVVFVEKDKQQTGPMCNNPDLNHVTEADGSIINTNICLSIGQRSGGSEKTYPLAPTKKGEKS